MSEEAPVEAPVELPEPAAVHPAVAEALAAIKAESEASANAAVAAAAAEGARCAKIDAVKAKVNAACGPINDALLATSDGRERAALEELMRTTIAPLEAELEAAYKEFVGGTGGDINPAPAGETFIDSTVTVQGHAQA